MAGYGGETPLIGFGLRLTVEAPTGTNATTPVEQGDLFKISGTASDSSGYKAAALVAGDDATNSVVIMALHRMTDVNQMGVIVLGPWQQVRRLNYVSGSAPTLGQSVEASAANVRKVAGKAFDKDGFVLKVDTSALQVEVLV
jgi:hypothetical protein